MIMIKITRLAVNMLHLLAVELCKHCKYVGFNGPIGWFNLKIRKLISDMLQSISFMSLFIIVSVFEV